MGTGGGRGAGCTEGMWARGSRGACRGGLLTGTSALASLGTLTSAVIRAHPSPWPLRLPRREVTLRIAAGPAPDHRCNLNSLMGTWTQHSDVSAAGLLPSTRRLPESGWVTHHLNVPSVDFSTYVANEIPANFYPKASDIYRDCRTLLASSRSVSVSLGTLVPRGSPFYQAGVQASKSTK